MKKIICLAVAVIMICSMGILVSADEDVMLTATNTTAMPSASSLEQAARLKEALVNANCFKASDLAAANNYIDSYIMKEELTKGQVDIILSYLDKGVALIEGVNLDADKLTANQRAEAVSYARAAASELDVNVIVNSADDIVFVAEDNPNAPIYDSEATFVRSTGFEGNLVPMVIVAVSAAALLFGAYVIVKRGSAKV